MGFQLYCDNKGCYKQGEHVVDKTTNQVICIDCGKEIKNITSFTKTQMISLGQVRKAEKTKQAWSVKCEACLKETPPKLSKDNKLVCGGCAKELTKLARPFADMIKQNLISLGKANQRS
jgi:hypothetical protein